MTQLAPKVSNFDHILDFIGNKDFDHNFSGVFLRSTRRLCKLQAMTMTRSEKSSFILRNTSLTHRERLMPAIVCLQICREYNHAWVWRQFLERLNTG